MITLGIIGIVAAITIPSIASNIQKVVLKNQFKKMYSTLYNAFLAVQTEEGRPISCYYWEGSLSCVGKCVGWNEFGTCNAWACQDGSPLPDNFNGMYDDCKWFYQGLFYEKLKTQKICREKALENGCLTSDYRGVDKIKQEQSTEPDYVADPGQLFSDSNIKERYPVIILADGSLIIKYNSMDGGAIFAIDVNGHKGPNKWGYDIFTFIPVGSAEKGITNFKSSDYALEKDGKSFDQMYEDAFRK